MVTLILTLTMCALLFLEQLTRILTLPFAALLTAWVCTLF